MSHFTVLVIGPDPEAQLYPFNEQPTDKALLQFRDTHDQVVKEYAEGTREMVILADGSMHWPSAEQFKVAGAHAFDTKYVYPADSQLRQVPFRELYPTLERFAKDWHGHDEDSKHLGRYGYWRNPNAKWDWYELGGRWTGYFKVKAGRREHAAVGKPGVFGRKAKSGFADSLAKGDIDFAWMRAEAGRQASATWDQANTIIAGRAFESWDTIRERNAGNIAAARDEYHAQPAVKDLNASRAFSFYDDPTDFLKPREEYVQRARDAAGCTFAVLKDGTWYEKGRMGWWATVIDGKEQEVWSKEVAALIDGLPDDTLLSVYDCHI